MQTYAKLKWVIISLCQQVTEINYILHVFVTLYFCQKWILRTNIKKIMSTDELGWIWGVDSLKLLKTEKNFQSCLHCVLSCGTAGKFIKSPQVWWNTVSGCSFIYKNHWCHRHKSRLNVLVPVAFKCTSPQVKCTQQVCFRSDLPSVWNIIWAKWNFLCWLRGFIMLVTDWFTSISEQPSPHAELASESIQEEVQNVSWSV